MRFALKKIINNCKQTTFLIEKRLSGKITTAEALQLQIHFAGCSICRTYQQQSRMITHLFTVFQSGETRLDDAFKLKLQQRIKKEMNKN